MASYADHDEDGHHNESDETDNDPPHGDLPFGSLSRYIEDNPPVEGSGGHSGIDLPIGASRDSGGLRAAR